LTTTPYESSEPAFSDPPPSPHRPPPASGGGAEISLLLLAVIWGVNFPVIKDALGSFHPLAFNALRFPLASLVLLLALRSRGSIPVPGRADLPRMIALGLVGNVLYQLLFIYGVERTTAGNASILLATTPIWTALLSAAAGHERLTLPMVLGGLGTLAGMILVVAGGAGTPSGAADPLGDLMMVAAGFCWAVYAVGARSMIHRYGPLPVTAWTLWVGTFVLVGLGAARVAATPLWDVSISAWFGVLYAGTLAIGLAYLLWNRGVRRVGTSLTAIYANLVPVVALGVAWLWLAEVPTFLQGAGAAVIITSVLLARGSREGRPEPIRTPAGGTGAGGDPESGPRRSGGAPGA